MTTRRENHGVRKICSCGRTKWAKCAHPWHMNFKWKEKHHRLSLDRYFGKHFDSKSEAIDAAADVRKTIKNGSFGSAAPQLEALTVQQLLDVYDRRHLQTKRAKSAVNLKYQTKKIAATLLPLPTNGMKAFGAWIAKDVTTDTIMQYEETRRPAGLAATNRDLSLLRAMFSWAVTRGYLPTTPFKRGTEVVVKLTHEPPRSRRLDVDEQTALLAACGPHLRAVVEAALETGMRKGEILSLTWKQVEGLQIDEKKNITWAAKSELFLPWGKTKTARDRRIPISTRLKAILEMRRFDPAGRPHAADTYVFGTEIGIRLLGVSRAWRTAVLKSHGYTPVYTETANLTRESRAALGTINLHFHDLRREAGSRWMDGGVPIATIQRWLGHSNVSQTSTYLAGTATSEHDAMNRFEAHQAALQRLATKGQTRSKRQRQTTTKHHRTSNKTAVERDTHIM